VEVKAWILLMALLFARAIIRVCKCEIDVSKLGLDAASLHSFDQFASELQR
jgi:hypothetical protein